MVNEGVIIEDEWRPRHGGKRPGAGRKKTNKRRGGPHRVRPELSPRHPVHTVLRVVRSLPSLRTRTWYAIVRKQLLHFLGREDFRVVHLSIQGTHLHFLVEANDRETLRRGMQSLAIRIARAINAHTGCRGKVFTERYHATQITTARQARNSLAYVLNNWRHHREDFAGGRVLEAQVDLYSSGVTFTGWIGQPRIAPPPGYEPLPVSAARTDLLRSEWRRYGKLDPFECPGPMWR